MANVKWSSFPFAGSALDNDVIVGLFSAQNKQITASVLKQYFSSTTGFTPENYDASTDTIIGNLSGIDDEFGTIQDEISGITNQVSNLDSELSTISTVVYDIYGSYVISLNGLNGDISNFTTDDIFLGSNNIFISNDAGANINIGTSKILNTMINSVDVTKITGILPISKGGTNYGIQYGPNSAFQGINYFDSVGISSSPDFYRNAIGRITISESGALSSPPTIATILNLSSNSQNSSRITLSGQEWYQSSNTSTEGLTFLLGKNRTNDRETWIIDSLNSTKNNSNPALRLVPGAPGGSSQINTVSTDGSIFLPIDFGGSSANTRVLGDSLSLVGNNIFASSNQLNITGDVFSFNGSGSATDCTQSIGSYYSKSPVVAGNVYAGAVIKTGIDCVFWGVNKNSVTGQLPANATFFSSQGSASYLSFGRGNGAGLPDKMDLYINTTGDVGVGNANLNVLVGSVNMLTPGKGLINKNGTNGLTFSTTLVGGTITVANPNITATSHVIVNYVSFSGTPASLRSTVGAGTVTLASSSGALDTSALKCTIQIAN